MLYINKYKLIFTSVHNLNRFKKIARLNLKVGLR